MYSILNPFYLQLEDYYVLSEVNKKQEKDLRYQHIVIGNPKSLRGTIPTKAPNINPFMFWWNIGLRIDKGSPGGALYLGTFIHNYGNYNGIS